MGTGNTLSLVSAAGTSAHFRFSYQESFRAFRIVPRAAESLSLTASGSALVLQSASGSAAQIFIAESASRSLGTSYTYQDNGNYLSTVTDAKGNTVSYTYDTAKGLLQSVTDAKGNVTSYTYNSAQRLSKVAAGGSEVTYTYNAAGDQNTGDGSMCFLS